MHKLDRIILEAYAAINEEERETVKFTSLSPAMQKSIEDRYGKSKHPDKDFLSKDMKTLFRTYSIDKETGSVGHKIINLPSFDNLYKDFSDIINDIKKLMKSDDVRKDKAARELFELIKTNFRKLQSYLRTERPEQYELMKMRRIMEIAVIDLKSKFLLTEGLIEDLNEEEPTPEEEPDMEAPEETVLEDATDQILSKFPSLKKAIIKLQTADFLEFVDTVDWISPRPTTFRVNLKNGQDYILKWTGKGFEAQIMGKRYFLDKIDDYQQALDKLNILYKEGPMKGAGEEGEAADPIDTSGGGGGGGDFPGDEGGGDVGGDEAGDLPTGDEEGGGEDLGDEPIDFEEPAEEPEA